MIKKLQILRSGVPFTGGFMFALILFFYLFAATSYAQKEDFRAPSYPLITHDPYFSIWMNNENPTHAEASHWTQKPMPIHAMLRIDGIAYRIMGESPAFIPEANLISTEITATQTKYLFSQGGVDVRFNFLSPLVPEDLDLVSRPLTYVTWQCRSTDNANHKIEIYFDISALASIDQKRMKIEWDKSVSGNLNVLKIGSKDQPVLARKGDDVRIDWGYLYLAGGSDVKTTFAGRGESVLVNFAEDKPLPEQRHDEMNMPFASYNPVLAMSFGFDLNAGSEIEKQLMVAYDDIYSVEYFHQKLEGYWKLKFKSIDQLLQAAKEEYPSILEKCNVLDNKISDDAKRIGGDEYAAICNLAFRQCMAAHKVVKDSHNEPLCFSKENFSNGSMGTVDVFYPASPYFLLFNVELMKAQTTPIFDYAEMEQWPWPYAPHDIGKYPIGNGQTYGGGEETEDNQMPVEECGNMLIMAAAIAKVEGNANYATKYWNTLTQWAGYLSDKGFDPENQLCTDDFAGHLAHNVNLSVKAIMGMASYAMLCEMRGLSKEAKAYKQKAKEMVVQWEKAANDGDHYRLAFDKVGSWSQKYNMVWDDLLGFNLFDEEIENMEIAFYLKQQNRYGLPLDSRETYTKLDWILWTASLANKNDEFRQLIAPVYTFLNETPNRVPMTDWYWTRSGELRGFIARSVVGGVYMELLKEKLAK